MNYSGIYKIKCDDCDSFYIGTNDRNFNIRFREHLANFRINKPYASKAAKHLVEHNHSCNMNNLEILQVKPKIQSS